MFQYPPWHAIEYDNGGNIIKYSGLVFSMLDELGKRLNFTYNVISPRDKYFGAPKSNGQFSGVIGQIQRGEAQLGATIMIVDRDRQKAVNFTIPISLEPYSLMFKRPQEQSKTLLFIDPFTPLVRIMS